MLKQFGTQIWVIKILLVAVEFLIYGNCGTCNVIIFQARSGTESGRESDFSCNVQRLYFVSCKKNCLACNKHLLCSHVHGNKYFVLRDFFSHDNGVNCGRVQ